jgi:8-oxo-dGTP pyrophosphatase MutT (NUDIX family)
MNPLAQAELELSRYLNLFPGEADLVGSLASQLESDQADVLSPRNMRGHITASAVVVDVPAMKALLVHHRLPNRWLQPGGHYESGQLWQAALREAVDKTGVQDPKLHDWSINEGSPIDIHSHRVAARPSRGEQAHIHHDFAYLMVADSTLPVAARYEELVDARWVSLAVVEELGDERLGRIVGKLESAGIVPSRRQ